MTNVLMLQPVSATHVTAAFAPAFIALPKRPLLRRRILVVEDEMMVLMDAEDMLLDLGCSEVVGAASLDEALEAMENGFFDAALVDLNLSGTRSYPVADALGARNVPFAFATGYGAQGLRPGDKDRPVLTKPYSLADLGVTMANLLRNEMD